MSLMNRDSTEFRRNSLDRFFYHFVDHIEKKVPIKGY